MKYKKIVKLKDGRECCIRNGTEADGKALLSVYTATHGQTDYLLSYPDEVTFTVEQESEYLKKKAESENEIELIAEVDGVIAGSAGIMSLGSKYKIKHRADFGISVDEKYWNLGIGHALFSACLECAVKAGYEQLELTVVADNEKAVAMYAKAGFTEFGRNPKGLKSRMSGYQEVIYMRKEL